MVDPGNFLVAYIAIVVLIIIAFVVDWQTAVVIGFALLLIGVGLFKEKKTRIIFVALGIGIITLLVAFTVGIGQAVITGATIIQIFGFISMIYSQRPLRLRDKELFHEIFEQISKDKPLSINVVDSPRYMMTGIWLVIAALFVQLTGMFLLPVGTIENVLQP